MVGNRNNLIHRYAFDLVEKGLPYKDIEDKVKEYNQLFAEPLPEPELESTVLHLVRKKVNQ